MADINLKGRIILKDDASQPIATIKKQLVDLMSMQSAAGAALGVLAGYGVMGLAGGVASLAQATMQTTWAMAEASAQSMRTEASFNRLAEAAGTSGAVILSAMRAASRGMIDDTSLMMAANRALVLGVADSAEEMAALTEAAIIRGRDMGLSARQALNDLVAGIGRMSPQILDNLGIAGAQQSIEEYAKSLGKTAQQLTDVEKKQALLNAVLASTQGVQIVDDAASAFERMETSIANAKDALGVLFAPAIAEIAQKIADATNAATDAITTSASEKAAARLSITGKQIANLRDEIESLQLAKEAFEFIDPAKAQSAQAEIDRLTALLSRLVDEWNANAAITGAVKIALEDFGVTAQGVGATLQNASVGINTMTRSVEELQAVLSNMVPVLSNLQSIRQSAIGRAESLAMQAVKLGADPQQVAAILGETTDAIWNMGLAFDATTEAQFLNKVAAEGQLKGLEDLVDGLTEAQRAAVRFASGGLSNMDRAFQNLESRVSNVLSQSLSLDVGLDLADFLPREDDINENARRLAAIMRDGLGDQEWMEEFKREVPAIFEELATSGDPQGAAAKILQEFQLGLRPELLDRDAVKERVRQMILGEQSMAAVAGEIAQELAQEMGLSLQQVQATMGSFGGIAKKGASGAEEGVSAGGNFQAGFVQGFSPSNTALRILIGLVDGFTQNQSLAAASGKAVGEVWGNNFLTATQGNIPARLIEVLTTLVTPQVWAQIQSLQSRTEPT